MGLLNEEKEDEAYYKDMNKNNHDESETDFNDLYDILFLKNNDFYKIFNVQTEQIENIMEDKEVMERHTRLDSLDEGEVYLKSISRQMSQAGSDFFKMHSDEENKNLEKKFAVLSEQVKIKSEQLEKSEEPNDSNVTKKFKDRLTRYYKFFEYRKQKLAAMRQPENKSTKAYIH